MIWATVAALDQPSAKRHASSAETSGSTVRMAFTVCSRVCCWRWQRMRIWAASRWMAARRERVTVAMGAPRADGESACSR